MPPPTARTRSSRRPPRPRPGACRGPRGGGAEQGGGR
uniref:Uncharacterized protein n=1 Tax=Arundo donax TaxID=35708 RepID=A0A0A9GDP9_ARUDO